MRKININKIRMSFLLYHHTVRSLVHWPINSKSRARLCISSYQRREVWPPTTVSTSFKILSAVGSRVLRLRWLEADFVVSGFPCFCSPFPASPRLLLGFFGSSSESGQTNIFPPPASASTRFSFPQPLSSSLSPPTGDARATVARAGADPRLRPASPSSSSTLASNRASRTHAGGAPHEAVSGRDGAPPRVGHRPPPPPATALHERAPPLAASAGPPPPAWSPTDVVRLLLCNRKP